jgi:hypothetical protein
VRGYKPAEIGNSLPKRVPQRKIELTQGFKAEGIVANFNILLEAFEDGATLGYYSSFL